MLRRCPLRTGHWQRPSSRPRRVTLRRLSPREVGSPEPLGRGLSPEVQVSMPSSVASRLRSLQVFRAS